MELTGKMEEFMNDLIGERMEQVYQEKDGQQYDPFNEKLEMKLQKMFQKLSDKQRTILFDYMTETSNKCSDLNELILLPYGIKRWIDVERSNSSHAGCID